MPIILVVATLFLSTLSTGPCFALNVEAIPVDLSSHVKVGDKFMGIRLMGTVRLSNNLGNKLALRGLSGLAWDEDAELLYAISDNAKVFHLRPVFVEGFLRDIDVLAGYPLQDANGNPLSSPWDDAEGLALENGANGVVDDGQLLVSFEGRPRIRRYTTTGKRLGEEALPRALKTVEAYASANKSLESLAVHEKWGLLTAPERALKGQPRRHVSIFSLNGSSWSYPLYTAPKSSLVAIETLPDGSLLTLERAFVSFLHPLIITLRQTWLSTPVNGPLTVKEVAVLDTSEGWFLDNFEGLTRHRDWRFFIVSDDNGRVLQNTLLVYFEVLQSVSDGTREASIN